MPEKVEYCPDCFHKTKLLGVRCVCKNKHMYPDVVWNDTFPPLNLWNYPKMDREYISPPGTYPQSFDAPKSFAKCATLAEYQAQAGSPNVGIKHDAGKVPLDLIDPTAIEGLAAVLAFGANKYAANNWRGGLSYSRLLAAMMRHLFAIMRGEDTDPESGLPHVDHVGCCWMFLSNMMKTRPDLDDRYKGKPA